MPREDVPSFPRNRRAVNERRFKFDVGDWIAIRNAAGEWRLAGKVIDADSESCHVEGPTGVRTHYAPEFDPIARVRWTGRGKWSVS